MGSKTESQCEPVASFTLKKDVVLARKAGNKIEIVELVKVFKEVKRRNGNKHKVACEEAKVIETLSVLDFRDRYESIGSDGSDF